MQDALALSSCIANTLGAEAGKAVRLLQVVLAEGRLKYARGAKEDHIHSVFISTFLMRGVALAEYDPK